MASQAHTSWRSSRVFSSRTGWWLACGLSVVLVIAALAQDRANRATVSKVAASGTAVIDGDERRALSRRVDDLGFPRRAPDGFRAIGGGIFEVDGRAGATVVWARGEQRVNYMILSGAEDVPLERPTQAQNVKIAGESRDLHWIEGGLLATKRNGRTVVITGSPPSKQLRRVMRRLAISV